MKLSSFGAVRIKNHSFMITNSFNVCWIYII